MASCEEVVNVRKLRQLEIIRTLTNSLSCCLKRVEMFMLCVWLVLCHETSLKIPPATDALDKPRNLCHCAKGEVVQER